MDEFRIKNNLIISKNTIYIRKLIPMHNYIYSQMILFYIFYYFIKSFRKQLLHSLMPRHLFKTIHKLFFLFILAIQSSPNLFCNSDFENYVLVKNINLFWYTLVYGDFYPDRCWYAKQITQFQVKKVGYFPGNQMASLQKTVPYYSLCQNLTLEINQNYEYSFDIGIHFYVVTSTVNVSINNLNIATFYKDNTTKAVLTNYNGMFTAPTAMVQFCVKSKETTQGTTLDNRATFVDNFNMIKTPQNITNSSLNSSTNSNSFSNSNVINSQSNSNIISFNNSIPFNSSNSQSFNNSFNNASVIISNNSNNHSFTSNLQQCHDYTLQFQSKVYDSKHSIVLTSTLPMQNDIAELIKQKIIIIIQRNVQRNIIYQINKDLHLQIQIILDLKTYIIKDMMLMIEDQVHYKDVCLKIYFQIFHRSILLNHLQGKQKKILDFDQEATKNTIKFFFDSYGQVRFFFLSYFVANFISFFNIIILYNFLIIQTQPQFSYASLEKLTQFYFNSFGRMIQMIQPLLDQFKISIDTDFNNFADTKAQKQKVPYKYHSYSWFNSYGISYNFLKNNLATLVSFIFLGFKVILFFGIRKIIRIYFPNVLSKSKGAHQIFVIQFLCNSSTVSISCLTSLQKAGDETIFQRLNTIIQTIFFLIIILLPFMYWIIVFSSFQKQKLRKQKSLEQQIRFKSKRYFKLFQFALHILIPCLIAMRNKISFIIIISLGLAFLSIYYFKSFSHFTRYIKIYFGLIVLVLLIHHSAFLFMFCMTLIDLKNMYDFAYFIKVTGLMVVFTVLFGSLIQLFDVLVNSLYIVYKIGKFALKKCDKSNQIQQKKQTLTQITQQKLIPVMTNKAQLKIIVQRYQTSTRTIDLPLQTNSLKKNTKKHKEKFKFVKMTRSYNF